MSAAMLMWMDRPKGVECREKLGGHRRKVHCTRHPRYGAVRKPRTTCEACWWVWFFIGGPRHD